MSLARGATSAPIAAAVSSTGLVSGTYTAAITITDSARNSLSIPVTLVISCGAIGRRGFTATATGVAATSLTLTDPGGWSDGDELIAVLAANTTTPPATPAGWNLIGSNSTGGDLGQWVFQSFRSGSATTTWNGFAAGKLAGAMAAYSGGNTASPIGAPLVPFVPAVTGSGSGNVDVNACTTAADREEIVAAYAVTAAGAGTGLSVGPGLTSISGDVSTGGAVGDVVLNVGSDLLVPAAGTGLAETGTVAPAQTASKLGGLFALNPAVAPPAIAVTRNPAGPSQGDLVTYSMLVTNPAGNAALSGLTMSDTLSTGITFVSLTADTAGAGLTLANAGQVAGASGTLATPLAAGGSIVFSLVGSLGCAVTAEQSSTVFAWTAGMCGSPVKIVDAFRPGLVLAPAVSVTRDPAVPTPGDMVTYVVTVTNNNTGSPLNAITMSDTLPAGVAFVSLEVDGAGAGLTLANAGQVAGASGSLASPLAPGNSITFTLVGTVGCAASGAQLDAAFAQTAGVCQQASVATDTFTPAAVNTPTVTVTHTPAAPAWGDTVTYQVVVTNPAGGADLNGLVFSDTLPAGVDFVSIAGGSDGTGDGLTLSSNAGAGAVEGASGTFAIPLAAGTSFTFTVTGVVTCAAAGSQSHNAYAATPGGCLPELSAADAFSLPALGLSIVKTQVTPSAGATVSAGAAVQYRIVVTNTGAMTLTSLTLVDTVAPQVVGITTSATGFALPAVADSASGSVYTWSGSGLTMGPSTSYTFTISGQAGTTCAAVSVGNTAYVTAGFACGTGLLPSSAASGRFTLSPPALAFTVSKTQVPSNPGVGQGITYRIVVTNTGGATITTVTVTDTVAGTVIGNLANDQPGGFGAPAITT
ncbi:MAG: hypothetical protein AAB368_03150, partial [bacterium]